MGRVKNKNEVTTLEITNTGCKSVDQHWDKEFNSGYIKGIEIEVIHAKTIEVKRVKNSIFISVINMVKPKNILVYMRVDAKNFKEKKIWIPWKKQKIDILEIGIHLWGYLYILVDVVRSFTICEGV